MAEPSSLRLTANFTSYGLIPQLPDELSRSSRGLPAPPTPTSPSSPVHGAPSSAPLSSSPSAQNSAPPSPPSSSTSAPYPVTPAGTFSTSIPAVSFPFPISGSACATIGPSLFVLGGSFRGPPSDAVQVFDARLWTWTTAPPMAVSRRYAAAGVIGGMLYIFGGCPASSDSWAEVFDPTSTMWAPVPSPPHLRSETIYGSAVLGGRLVATSRKGGLWFDPAAADDALPGIWDGGWVGHAALVDGVIYFEDLTGNISGYDAAAEKAEEKLKRVDGLDGKLPDIMCSVTMANMGGGCASYG